MGQQSSRHRWPDMPFPPLESSYISDRYRGLCSHDKKTADGRSPKQPHSQADTMILTSISHRMAQACFLLQTVLL
jgi:hypothetical protein